MGFVRLSVRSVLVTRAPSSPHACGVLQCDEVAVASSAWGGQVSLLIYTLLVANKLLWENLLVFVRDALNLEQMLQVVKARSDWGCGVCVRPF